MIFGKRITTRLDLLKPDVLRNVDEEIVRQKKYFDWTKGSKIKEFEAGEDFWVLKKDGKGYKAGKIEESTGELSYQGSLKENIPTNYGRVHL